MSTTCSVVVVAAGAGLRMGGGIPKQFRNLAGHPALAWSLAHFDLCSEVTSVTVVAPSGGEEDCRILLDAYPFAKLAAVVEGGALRQHSVRRGLAAVDVSAEIIAVHDGARPFPPTNLHAAIAHAVDVGGAVFGYPVTDALKLSRDDRVASSVDRANLWAVQTPQVFRRSLLLDALQSCERDGREVQDDAGALEAVGHPVALVEGSRTNLKLTEPADLALAEALVSSGQVAVAARAWLEARGTRS